MSALPDLQADFLALERHVESLPEGVNAEVARGIFLMTPRPRVRHGRTLAELLGWLRDGPSRAAGPDGKPEWLFVPEPEIRSAAVFSRLIPDVAGWRRSTTVWPGEDESLVERMPDWVAEVISPGSESADRGVKKTAYGLMGIGWLWIVDPEERLVEAFANVRGQMLPGRVARAGETLLAPPFEDFPLDVAKTNPTAILQQHGLENVRSL